MNRCISFAPCLFGDCWIKPTRRTLGLLLVYLLITGCTPSPGAAATPVPLVTAAAEGDGNEVTVSAEGEATIINVHSQRGIGAATIEPAPGASRENILIRLHLAGLEEFRLSYDQTVITARIASGASGRVTQSIVLPAGDEQPIMSGNPYWMDIRIVSDQAAPRIPLDKGYFEVRLPEDSLHEKYRSFSIRWIDFYR